MASLDLHDQNDWQQNKSVLESNKYMFEHQLHCDVTFFFANRNSLYEEVGSAGADTGANAVRPDFISAHKYVLMSRSPAFYAKFTDPNKGSPSSNQINVNDVNKAVFVKMLRYIYFEEVQFSVSNVCELLYCATKCLVSQLAGHCRKFIHSKVNPKNACLFLDKLSGMGETFLEQKCLGVIDTAPNEVFGSAHFTGIQKTTLKRIIERDTLDAAEIDVFDACLTWAKAKCEELKYEDSDASLRMVLGEVLYFIRFPVMELDVYTNRVATRKLLSSEEALETLLYLSKAKSQCEAPFLSTKRKIGVTEVIFEPLKVHFESGNCDTYVTFREQPIRVSALYFVNPSNINLEEISIGNYKSSNFSEVPGRSVGQHRLWQATFSRAVVLTPGEHAVNFSAPVDPHKLYPALEFDDKIYDEKAKPIFPSYPYGHFLVGFQYKLK